MKFDFTFKMNLFLIAISFISVLQVSYVTAGGGAINTDVNDSTLVQDESRIEASLEEKIKDEEKKKAEVTMNVTAGINEIIELGMAPQMLANLHKVYNDLPKENYMTKILQSYAALVQNELDRRSDTVKEELDLGNTESHSNSSPKSINI